MSLIPPVVDGVSTAHLPIQKTYGVIPLMSDADSRLWRRACEVARDDAPYWVYRHLDADGRLLYVGCTVNMRTRNLGHKSNSPWWPDVARIETTRYENGVPARAAERAAIWHERPLYNVVGNPDHEAARVRRAQRKATAA